MAKQKTIINTAASSKSNVSIGFSLKRERLYALIVFAFSFVLYFNSVFNSYNMDDELVTQNHRLTKNGISAIPEIFKSPYYQDEAGYKYEYRPLVLVAFAIEHSVFGEHAWLSHFINVVLYALLCVLLFFVLKTLLSCYSIFFSFLVTMLFAAHPVHTEVVASIKNRDEIMALGFSLLTLYYALQFVQLKKPLLLLAVAFFFLLGILSKTTTLTFILIIPVLLVLFADISLKQLLSVTAILIFPGVFFARLNSLPGQIALVILVLSASAFLYALKHRELFLTYVRNYFRQFSANTKNTAAPTPDTDTLDYSFFKNIPVMATWLTGIAATFCIAVAGLHFGNIWLTCLPVLLWSILFLFVRNEVKLLLVTPISLLATLAALSFSLGMVAIEAALVVFLANLFVYGNKQFKIVCVVNYLIYAVAFAFFKHSGFFFVVIAFVGLMNRRTYWLTAVILLISLCFYINTLFRFITGTRQFTLMLLNLPIIYAGALLIWQKKTTLLQRIAVISLPALIAVYFFILPPVQHNIVATIQHNYMLLNHIEATNLSPVESVRPLIFIERPVGYYDPLSIKLGTAMLVLGKYLKLMLMPYPLSFYYGYAVISPTSLWGALPLAVLAIHLALLAIAIFYFRKQPLVSASLFIYLIAIAVFSNLVIPVPGAMGDRFLFIPSIGACLLLAFLLLKVFKLNFNSTAIDLKELKTPFKISLLVILLIYSGLTVARNSNWKDRITLFRHDIHAVEKSAQAHNLLALHLFIASNAETDPQKRQALREEALPHFKRAIEIYPKFLNASFDYARLLDAMGRYNEAIAAYQYTTTVDTTFTAPYFSMGVLYQNLGKHQESVINYQKYLNTHPYQMEIYANLSFAYFKLAQYDKSIEINRRAIGIKPQDAFNPTVNIAKTYLKMNQLDSALYYFEAAQRIYPTEPNVARFINDLHSRK